MKGVPMKQRKQRPAGLFQALLRKATGNNQRPAGTIDSSTGRITFDPSMNGPGYRLEQERLAFKNARQSGRKGD